MNQSGVDALSLRACVVSSLAFLAGMLLPVAAEAVDPPRLTVREALSQGRNALLGYTLKLEYHEEAGRRGLVVMTVRVTECLFGSACKSMRHTLRMSYVSATYRESELPVEFCAGCEVLLILRRDPVPGATYSFESDLSKKPDFAFAGHQLPKSPQDEESGYFESVYTGKGETVEYRRLREWALSMKGQSEPSK